MSLDSLLDRVYELPSIPKVVQELITSFSSNSADANSISRNIHSDPVIAAKVLRLANSARYGAGREIASLDTAVVMLGFDTLKTLVVASGITSIVTKIPGLDMKRFWRQSFMVANLSKFVAKTGKELDVEVAFTCGMLHNIGLALMYLVHGEKMKALADTADAEHSRSEQELAELGYTSHEVSCHLARLWRFPAVIQEALRYQENPLAITPASEYAAVVNLAVKLNEGLEQELSGDEIITTLPEGLVSLLQMDTDKLSEQLQQLCDTEDDIDTLLAA